LNDPLTVERLRTERPSVSKHLLNGLQASSFPIQAADFHAVMALLGETLDELPPHHRLRPGEQGNRYTDAAELFGTSIDPIDRPLRGIGTGSFQKSLEVKSRVTHV